jgi:hypothetical protein
MFPRISLIKLQSHLHPGIASVDVRVIWERLRYDREEPEYIRNSAGNVRDDPGTSGIRPQDGIEYLISPGWSGMIREV